MRLKTAYLDKNKLIRIWKAFKREPQKIFVAKELNERARQRIYLTTLTQMGLIEELKTFYYAGNQFAKRRCRGYRLK